MGGYGYDSFENFNPACSSCNCSKASFDLDDWRQELTLKVDRLNRDYSLYRIVKSFGLIKETKKSVTFYFERYGKAS
jgi:plasmid rolling circle replication initiator protein Rep